MSNSTVCIAIAEIEKALSHLSAIRVYEAKVVRKKNGKREVNRERRVKAKI